MDGQIYNFINPRKFLADKSNKLNSEIDNLITVTLAIKIYLFYLFKNIKKAIDTSKNIQIFENDSIT